MISPCCPELDHSWVPFGWYISWLSLQEFQFSCKQEPVILQATPDVKRCRLWQPVSAKALRVADPDQSLSGAVVGVWRQQERPIKMYKCPMYRKPFFKIELCNRAKPRWHRVLTCAEARQGLAEHGVDRSPEVELSCRVQQASGSQYKRIRKHFRWRGSQRGRKYNGLPCNP